jgi:hypothetical protein
MVNEEFMKKFDKLVSNVNAIRIVVDDTNKTMTESLKMFKKSGTVVTNNNRKSTNWKT